METKPLCQSHIIPEFCYAALYDRSKGYAFASKRANPDQPYRIQKGAWGYLLCKDCEHLLNVGCEAYFKRAWYTDRRLPSGASVGRLVVTGLDWARFRLFHLSVLWRASVSTHELFKGVRVDGTHEERLRQIVLTQDAEIFPSFYGFTADCLTHDNGAVFHMISDGQRIRYTPGIARFVLIYAGCAWTFYVCSFTPLEIRERVVQRDGSMVVQVYRVFDYFGVRRPRRPR